MHEYPGRLHHETPNWVKSGAMFPIRVRTTVERDIELAGPPHNLWRPSSRRRTETPPFFQREIRQRDDRKLARDEGDEPPKCPLLEAVAVQTDAEQVHAEPAPARDDVAEDGQAHQAARFDQAAPARVEDDGV